MTHLEPLLRPLLANLPFIAFLLGLFVVFKILAHPNVKGWFGERRVRRGLASRYPTFYQIHHDLYIPRPDGEELTQIDHDSMEGVLQTYRSSPSLCDQLSTSPQQPFLIRMESLVFGEEKGFVRAFVAFRSRTSDAAVEIIEAPDGLCEIHRGVLNEIPVSGKRKEPRHGQGVQARGNPVQIVGSQTANGRESNAIGSSL